MNEATYPKIKPKKKTCKYDAKLIPGLLFQTAKVHAVEDISAAPDEVNVTPQSVP